MIIRSIEISRFGLWKDLRLSRLAEGVNLFYGPNEIGKTTLMQFIRSVFFGFSPASLHYLDKDHPTQSGGTITVQTPAGVFHISRYAVRYPRAGHEPEPKNAEKAGVSGVYDFSQAPAEESLKDFVTRFFDDGLTITDARGTRQDARILFTLLGGRNLPAEDVEDAENAEFFPISASGSENALTEKSAVNAELFSSIFAIGLRELQQLSVLDSTQAAERLYRLSTGLERNSLQLILNVLQENAAGLLRPGDRIGDLHPAEIQESGFSEISPVSRGGYETEHGWILRQIYRRELLLQEMDSRTEENEKYARMIFQKERVAEDIQAKQTHLDQLSHQTGILKIAAELQPVWDQREALDEKIVEFQKMGFPVGRRPLPGEFLHDGKFSENLDGEEESRGFPENAFSENVSGGSGESPENMLASLKTHLQKLSAFQEEIRKHSAQQKSLREENRKRTREIRDMKLYPELLGMIPRMEAVLLQEERIETLKTRLTALRHSISEICAQLEVEYRRLGLPVPDFQTADPAAEIKHLNTLGTLRPLRVPMKEVGVIQKTLRKETRQLQEFTLQADALDRQVQEHVKNARERILAANVGLADIFQEERNFSRDGKGFSERESLHSPLSTLHSPHTETLPSADVLAGKLGEKAAKFRRRDGILAQLTQMDRAAEDQKNAWENYSRERIPSRPVLTAMGACFIGGMALMLTAAAYLFGILTTATPGFYFLILMLGTVLWMSVLFFKVHRDWKFRRTREEMRRERETLAGQMKKVFQACFPDFPKTPFPEMPEFLPPANIYEKPETETGSPDVFRNAPGDFPAEILLSTETSPPPPLTPSPAHADFPSGEILRTRCAEEREKLRASLEVLQKEIILLEEKTLQASRRDALRAEVEHGRSRIKNLRHDLHAARARREEALRKMRLPETWKPADVKNMLRAADRLTELWRRWARDEEDESRYKNELSLFSEKITRLLSEMGEELTAQLPTDHSLTPSPLPPFTPSPAHLLTCSPTHLFPAIREKIAEQSLLQEQKKLAIHDLKELRKKLRKSTSRLQKMDTRRRSFLYRLGVENEDDLRRRIQNLENLTDFYRDRREIQKKIDAVINFHCTENAIWEIYEKYDAKQLLARIQILSQKWEIENAELEENRKKLQNLESRLWKLETDDTLPRLKYELSLTEQRILAAIRQWRSLMITHRLVETVKKTYESKRQPWTLKTASRYLASMTEEKYVRVWTPVDADILLVDRRDGEVFTVSQLSAGTRELLFLALRLALMEGYRRQNILLPVILDDVLVNFDKKRAQATVDVLCDFSRKKLSEASADENSRPGLQFFVFTCHEHIRNLFLEKDVEICNMENTAAGEIENKKRKFRSSKG